MNTTSQPSLLCRCLRSLQVLAGFSIFGLLYTNCWGPFARSTRIDAEEMQDTIEDVKAVTTNGSANQSTALSRGEVCAPNH